MRAKRQRYQATGVVFVSVLWLVGCGGGSPADPPTPAGESADPTPSGPDSTPSPAPAPAATAEPAPEPTSNAAPTAPAALVTEHEAGGVEVVLQEVRRASGDSLTVRWRYHNRSADDKILARGSASWSDPYRLSWGAYLLDPVNKKKYLIITDAEGVPVASRYRAMFGELILPAGQEASAWAKFPAPPDDVESLSVYLPGIPPIEDVPITR